MAGGARVYVGGLFRGGGGKGRRELGGGRGGRFAGGGGGERERGGFLFWPYPSSAAKGEGVGRGSSGAEPELWSFLEMRVEKHRMREIFRIRREFDELWKKENRRLDVTVISAVELDQAVVEKIGQEVERQTGEAVELSSRVDDDILGGIVLQVGNMVLDASIRSRLEKLRKTVATAAH